APLKGTSFGSLRIMARSEPNSPEAAELSSALGLFHQLLDPRLLQQWQPTRGNAVYTTAVVVWLLVYQRLNPAASLQTAVARFLDDVGAVSTNKRVREDKLSANTAAYSRARSRLQLAVAEKSADHVFTTLAAASAADQSVDQPAERRTFLIDGTTLALASRDELRRRWPPASNQHGDGVWPISHLVLACELETGLMLRPEVGAMYGDAADGEVALAIRLPPRIPPRSLLMADRNFGVFGFVYHAAQAGREVVTRLTAARFQSLRKKAEPLGAGRWKLTWTPTRDDRRTHPDLPADAAVAVFLVEFAGRDGRPLWVASTLDLAAAEAADRYLRRWEIETDLRSWKTALGVDALRGRSVEMVLKEVAMGALAYNLVVEVRRLAAARAKIPAKRISFAGVWSLVTITLFSPKERSAEEWREHFDRVLRWAAQRKLPNRPGRSYPRQVLPRRRKHPERPRKPKPTG
ncbi:MAG: IS4 family transposase, partial [Planctomycetia bacterium]